MTSPGRAIRCVLAAVILTALWGCNKSQEKICIGVARESLSALTYIAIEKGFFTKEGLDVSVREYPSGKLALAGLFRGDVLLATASGAASAAGIMQHGDARIIATIGTSDNEIKIVARKDKGILRPEDLRGKRLATQEASAVHFFLSLFLAKHRLSEQDVVLSFSDPGRLVDALAKGEIDALSMREPYIGRARHALRDAAVIFEEPGLYLKTFEVLGLERFLASRPLAASAFLRGLLRAEKFARQHPRDAAEIVASAIGASVSEIVPLLKEARLAVSLDESLLYSLEDEARWVVSKGLAGKARMPDFYSALYWEGLKAVMPQRVTISER